MDEAKRLSETQLDELQRKYVKVGVVDYNDHQIVFRRPTREDCREYRRMVASDAEKHEAMERLAQATLCAFDGVTDVNAARTTYTGVFLVEYPLFVNVPRVYGVLAALAGLVEEEDAKDMGKGACIRSARLTAMRTDSPTGSDTAA